MAVNDFGSDYSAFDKHYNTDVPRSVFDKSQLHSFTTDFGILRPFYFEYTVPGDDYDISVETLVKALALVHPPLTRVRYFIHFYFQPHLNDLWHQFDNFVTLGNTGKVDLEPPRLAFSGVKRLRCGCSDVPFSKFSNFQNSLVNLNPFSINRNFFHYHPLIFYPTSNDYAFTCGSLSEAFGLPPFYSLPSDATASSLGSTLIGPTIAQLRNTFVDAFPYAMYQNIYRCFYNNKDIAISASFNNTQLDSWQPLDYHSFGLRSGPCESMRDDLLTSPGVLDTYDGSTPIASLYSSTAAYQTVLDTVRLRNWRGDYFTTAKLWPQRGNPPTLKFGSTASATTSAQIPSLPLTLDSGQTVYVTSAVGGRAQATLAVNQDPSFLTIPNAMNHQGHSELFVSNTVTGSASGQSRYFPQMTGHTTAQSININIPSVSVSGSITVQNLAALEIINLWQQRNAFTDGTYNQIIKAQFGVYPNLDEYAPVYIGGTSGDISFTEVLQSVQSSDVPLGEQAGHGMTVGSGRIGHVHSNDYGMIMGIISIMPDSQYYQGVPREMTKQSYVDYYYPLFNGLGPQGILTKELYYTYGASTTDDKVFGYQGRYDEMRYKPNLISGQLANHDDEYWKAWTITRHFSSAPNLNLTFLSSKDIPHTSFAYDGEPPFIVQIATRARAVRPMPSQAPMVTL